MGRCAVCSALPLIEADLRDHGFRVSAGKSSTRQLVYRRAGVVVVISVHDIEDDPSQLSLAVISSSKDHSAFREVVDVVERRIG